MSVILFGRPNVGKSTLFNLFVNKPAAIVYDRPGVTQDFQEDIAKFQGLTFKVTDTPGVLDNMPSLEKDALILFMVDGKEGMTPYDREIARFLRQQGLSVTVLVNKTENSATDYCDFLELGFDDVVPISAKYNIGLESLRQIIEPFATEKIEQEKPALKMAIIGRPNTGKSTLVNTLLGEEKQLTGDTPGLTRDSIKFSWFYKGQRIDLVDTAGIRRRNKVADPLEKLAVSESFHALKFCDVAVLLIDGTLSSLDKQDILLANRAHKEGRGLVVCVNKWDAVKNKEAYKKYIQKELKHYGMQNFVFISALNKTNVNSMMRDVFETYKQWNTHIKTSVLNVWLKEAVAAHQPPVGNHNLRIKFKYMLQKSSRPPSFLVFASQNCSIPGFYEKYLKNKLQEDFSLQKSPIRMSFSSSENPFKRK